MRRIGSILVLGILGACRSLPEETYPGGATPAEPGSWETALAAAERVFAERPRDPERVAAAYAPLVERLETGAAPYEALWKIARALVWLGSRERGGGGPSRWIEPALKAALTAAELEPDRVEGHYYRALAAGLAAEGSPLVGLSAVHSMRAELERARQIDPRFDAGGPDRVLGVLYLRAPRPPFSIGDTDRAREHLLAAEALAPDVLETQFYLGELAEKTGDRDAARRRFAAVLGNPAPSEDPAEVRAWQEQARARLRD